MALITSTDYLLPQELTGYVRTAFGDLAINQPSLARWLPNVTLDDLEFRLDVGQGPLNEIVGAFRAYDTESPIIGRRGIKRISGELPPLSLKTRLSEYDRLRQRKATGQQVRDAILNDVDRLVRVISNRMELARADALVNGSVTLSENGLSLFMEFDRRPEHQVTATTLWSATGSDPLNDLLNWHQTYIDSNGVGPGSIVTSRRVLSTLIRNESMRNIVFPGVNQPGIVTEAAVNDALTAFGLPRITTYDAQVSVNKVAQRVIPEDKLLMLPAPGDVRAARHNELGATQWGTTAESLEPEFGLTGAEPGLVAGAYSDDDPVALWTKVAAIGVPLMANPNLSFVADVL